MIMQQKYKPSWIKISLLALGLVALIAGGYFLVKKFWPSAPQTVYEMVVQVRDQPDEDPVEDARTNMKKGDVLVAFPVGHKWSETEKTSYLILKMKLTQEQLKKLTTPEKEQAEQESGDAKAKHPPAKIIRMRPYRIKIEQLNFNLDDFSNGQPFTDKIFGWEIVEKKKSAK